MAAMMVEDQQSQRSLSGKFKIGNVWTQIGPWPMSIRQWGLINRKQSKPLMKPVCSDSVNKGSGLNLFSDPFSRRLLWLRFHHVRPYNVRYLAWLLTSLPVCLTKHAHIGLLSLSDQDAFQQALPSDDGDGERWQTALDEARLDDGWIKHDDHTHWQICIRGLEHAVPRLARRKILNRKRSHEAVL